MIFLWKSALIASKHKILSPLDFISIDRRLNKWVSDVLIQNQLIRGVPSADPWAAVSWSYSQLTVCRHAAWWGHRGPNICRQPGWPAPTQLQGITLYLYYTARTVLYCTVLPATWMTSRHSATRFEQLCTWTHVLIPNMDVGDRGKSLTSWGVF